MTLGLLIDDQLKEKVKFVNDKSIGIKLVNETCERCRATNCNMRVAPPRVWKFNENLKSMKQALQGLK